MLLLRPVSPPCEVKHQHQPDCAPKFSHETFGRSLPALVKCSERRLLTMAKSRKFSADRRKFLKGAAVAGAATLAPAKPAVGALYERPGGRTPPLQDPRAETRTPPEVEVLTADHCGSDF